MKKNQTISGLLLVCLMTVLLCSCSKNVDPIALDSIIRFKSIQTQVVADGDSTLKAVVQIHKQASPGKRTVEFSLTRGVFENGSTTYSTDADTNGEVTVFVKSSQIGSGLLIAKSGEKNITASLVFDSAYPNYILVSSAASIPHGLNSSTTITATLKRFHGNPTEGFWVNFAAEDSIGNIKAVFTNVSPSDANDEAKGELHLNDPFFKGTLYIKVNYSGNNQNLVGQNIMVAE